MRWAILPINAMYNQNAFEFKIEKPIVFLSKCWPLSVSSSQVIPMTWLIWTLMAWLSAPVTHYLTTDDKKSFYTQKRTAFISSVSGAMPFSHFRKKEIKRAISDLFVFIINGLLKSQGHKRLQKEGFLFFYILQLHIGAVIRINVIHSTLQLHRHGLC